MKCISCTILIFISFAVNAQLPNIGFTRYTTQQGLAEDNSIALLQDQRGLLWIGTGNGLSRFDGRFFKNYATTGLHGLTDLSIVCLTEDGDGAIWIGTQNGLNKLDPVTENITQYYEGRGKGTIPYKWCNYLFCDKEKNLWLSTEKGIAVYDKRINSFINYPISVYGKDENINKFISRIVEDSRGRFWLATSFGIKRFDRKTKTYTSYYYADAQKKDAHSYPIMSIVEDKEGVIWAGTWGGGLLKFNEALQRFEKQKAGNESFERFVISDIAPINIQSESCLLLATNNGLFLLHTIAPMHLDSLSLTTNINSLYADHQGNTWVSSGTGLYKLNRNSLSFQWISLPRNKKDPDVIFHIIPDIKKPSSVFYLSTVYGWWRFDKELQKITAVALPADPANLLGGINDWVSDEHGYWFTSVKGFGYYDLAHSQLKDLSRIITEKQAGTATGIMVRDLQGKFWISLNRNGILVYDATSGKTDLLFCNKKNPDNAVGEDIHDLKVGPDGAIYFTLRNGLYKVDTKNYSYHVLRPLESNDRVDANKISPDKICITNDGRLFVNSKLQIYELKGDKLLLRYPLKGYASMAINELRSNSIGRIWVNTSVGIFKTDTSFKQWIPLNKRLGWDETEKINDLLPNGKDEILFASTGKIGLLNDTLLPDQHVLPTPLILRFKHGETENYLPAGNPGAIDCDYKESVEIELGSVDFINEAENEMLYRLEGWDNEWKALKGRPFVRYEQLPPGSYVFSARQVSTNGVESNIVSVAFRIGNPFYTSWWFLTSLCILIAALIYLIYRYRLKKLIEMERLRTRIATDLHDDIGATLSSISMYSDALKQQVKEKLPHLEHVVDKIGENSRDMVNNMSDIVWAINPGNDDGGKLLHRIENYARDLCSVKNILTSFQMDDTLNQVSLPLEYRKNIYLVFKEALNNALKYAQATHIAIELKKDGNRFSMCLTDDGTGFDIGAENAGNGLKNMVERAKEINGETIIVSAKGKGTAVTFTCNLPR